MYPRLTIDIPKLQHNCNEILQLCKKNRITSIFLVTKVLAGHIPTIEAIWNLGFSHLADSRIENLVKMQHIPLPKVLLRLPMLSEVPMVVRHIDCTLQSELATIRACNQEAIKQQKKHQILLMFDLGDLREGIFYQENYLSMVEEILSCSNIELLGIGTNLTCYGGVIPTVRHLNQLLAIKEKIETTFSISIQLVSAGNSSSIPLLEQKKMVAGINNLRIGEAIFLGRETSFGKHIPNTFTDVFHLEASFIEVQHKPSFPIGKTGMNSFGEVTNIIDQGWMRRGILAIGKQDIQLDNITPLDPQVSILGGSSDHLIVNVSKTNYRVHDILRFQINYPGLLQLMTSKYVYKDLQFEPFT